jgi:hypothetical protein
LDQPLYEGLSAVEVVRAELTDPYKVLTAGGFARRT